MGYTVEGHPGRSGALSLRRVCGAYRSSMNPTTIPTTTRVPAMIFSEVITSPPSPAPRVAGRCRHRVGPSVLSFRRDQCGEALDRRRYVGVQQLGPAMTEEKSQARQERGSLRSGPIASLLRQMRDLFVGAKLHAFQEVRGLAARGEPRGPVADVMDSVDVAGWLRRPVDKLD